MSTSTQVEAPPERYTTHREEYDALTCAAGLAHRSHLGRLELTGEDTLDLLNRLSTNKLEDLTPGEGMGSVLTSAKGRIVDLLLVLMLEDRLLLIVGPDARERVAEWIDFYTFTEDVTARDVTPDTSMFSLIGPGAAGIVEEIAGEGAAALPQYGLREASIGGVSVTVVRDDFGELPGFDVIAPASDGERLWRYMVERSAGDGAKPVGTLALESVRVEQGVPAPGRELSEDYNPLEAGLLQHISFSKGCYIGQEVIARLDTYKKVSKYLVGLSWDSPELPPAGASLTVDGKSSGVVTSAVRSERLGRGIGLGYVRKAHAEPGSALTLEQGGREVEVRVEALPFR